MTSRWPIVILLLSVCSTAAAHKLGVSYVEIKATETGFSMAIDIDPHDLPFYARIDHNGDGEVTAQEIGAQREALAAFVFGQVETQAYGEHCVWEKNAFVDHYASDVSMWHAQASFVCSGALSEQTFNLGFVDKLARDHQCFVKLTAHDGSLFTHTLRPQSVMAKGAIIEAREHRLGLEFWQSLKLGLHHIFDGLDHLAFILALLIGARSLRQAVYALTAFTAAHSITLVLAGLGFLTLPSRWVEVAIACSVSFVAIENLWGGLQRVRVPLAFTFGLVHGLGFASLLEPAHLSTQMFAVTLLGFNLGIELGQVALTVLALPALLGVTRGQPDWRQWLPLPFIPLLLCWAGAPENAYFALWTLVACAALAWWKKARWMPWLSVSLAAAGLFWAVDRW